MSEPGWGYMWDKLQKTADAQTMTVYCLRCPTWSVTGVAAVTRAAAIAHREKKHPETVNKERVKLKRRAFSKAMTEEREAEIDEERRQRMRALGIG